MSFIQLNGIDEVSELPLAPEGRYPLVITSQSLKDSKDGTGKNIMVILEIENQDKKYANIFHYIALPRGNDADKDQNMLLMAKRFFVQFGIPIDGGINLEQMVGSRADCNVKQDEFEGNLKNVLVIDRLPTEE